MSLDAPYLWLKAFHVAAAITFAGAVVAFAPVVEALAGARTLTEEQRRLARTLRGWHRRITTPAMFVVWALGLTLAVQGGWLSSLWLQLKLALVVVLSGLYGAQSGVLRRLEGGSTGRPRGLFLTGLTAVALTVGIAALAVVKPF